MRKNYRIISAILLAVSLVFGQFNIGTDIIYAYEEKSAVIVCPEEAYVSARSGPGTENSIDHNLTNGKALTIVDEANDSNGVLWYKVKYNLVKDNSECISYVRSDYVSVTGENAADGTETENAVPDDAAGDGTTGDDTAPDDSSDEDIDTYEMSDQIATLSLPYATGSITGVNVKVRTVAGDLRKETEITSLSIGDSVSISGETIVSGDIWYNVSGTKNGKSFNGWTIGKYISVSYTDGVNSDYAQQLRNAGFPDSYIPNLAALHAKYPNWTFQALSTGLDWNTVLDKEMKNGVNLVQSSADDAKKSTNSGAYNWYTNKWTEYETGWVSVGRDYLAYCMDPRNFLNETNIFMFEDISYNSNQSLAGVQSIVAGTFMQGTKTYSNNNETIDYASSIYDIAQRSGVSSYHIASKIRQEQGAKGTSPLISGTYKGYEGYYNFFNFNAYGSTKDAIYVRGLKYAKKQGWSSRYLSILGGANKIKSDYINRGQNTIYLEKFNVSSLSAVGTHQYMSNVSGAISEGQNVGKGYTDKTQAFNFVIPVYTNMPQSACAFTASGNPNNYLSSLSIAGLSLTPGFNGATQTYSLVVDNSVSSVTVSAAALVKTSTVSGTGSYNLNVGNNTIQVVCKSQSGSARTYTITIYRNSSGTTGGEVVNTNAGFTSTVYSVGTYITGIQPGTDTTTLLAGLSSSNTVKILDASGNEKSGNVVTGDSVAVYDTSGNMIASTKVVIYGDVNGDGKINVLDMIKLNRHITGKGTLTSVYLEAADANRRGDGATVLDMIILNNHITGKKTINQ